MIYHSVVYHQTDLMRQLYPQMYWSVVGVQDLVGAFQLAVYYFDLWSSLAVYLQTLGTIHEPSFTNIMLLLFYLKKGKHTCCVISCIRICRIRVGFSSLFWLWSSVAIHLWLKFICHAARHYLLSLFFVFKYWVLNCTNSKCSFTTNRIMTFFFQRTMVILFVIFGHHTNYALLK